LLIVRNFFAAMPTMQAAKALLSKPIFTSSRMPAGDMSGGGMYKGTIVPGLGSLPTIDHVIN